MTGDLDAVRRVGTMAGDLDAVGDATRRAVLGDAHVDAARAGADGFTTAFQEYATRAAWGLVWARPGLDRRVRSCLTLALLTALRCENELPMHLRAAIRAGVGPVEIREVLLHTAVYAGLPAANTAFGIAQRVLAELGVQLDAEPPTDPDEPATDPDAESGPGVDAEGGPRIDAEGGR